MHCHRRIARTQNDVAHEPHDEATSTRASMQRMTAWPMIRRSNVRCWVGESVMSERHVGSQSMSAALAAESQFLEAARVRPSNRL